MKPFPSDSMAQHSRMIDAFCEDLLAGEYHAPRAKAVAEISRQLSTRSTEAANNRPVTDK